MFLRGMIGFVLAASVLMDAGCSRRLSRVYPPSIDASSAAAKAVEMYDADGNGAMSGAELDKCPGLKAALAKIDGSGQGKITAEKIAARIKQWQETGIGRMQLFCTVLRNGKPLAGAEVKFVPEKFLGDEIKTASGKTNSRGRAALSVATSSRADPPGVALGLYRVEISKAGESIPAKYNSETTLGQEVAVDCPAFEKASNSTCNTEHGPTGTTPSGRMKCAERTSSLMVRYLVCRNRKRSRGGGHSERSEESRVRSRFKRDSSLPSE